MRAASSQCQILVVLLGLLLAGYFFAGIVASRAKMQAVAPLCARRGLAAIDTGMGQSAKCYDINTGLMYLPMDVLRARGN